MAYKVPPVPEIGVDSVLFSAFASNKTNVTGDGTTYTIVFNNENYDVGSNFSTSTGQFTAPVNGRYFFCANVLITGLTSSHDTGSVYLSKNGGTSGSGLVRGNFAAMRTVTTVTDNVSVNLCDIVELATNDTMDVRVVILGGTLVADLSINNTSFRGYLLAAT